MTEDSKNQLTVLLPSAQEWDDSLLSQNILPIADEQVLDFINKLSQTILTTPEFRTHPELMAMGFWMRKAHILNILHDCMNKPKEGVRLARGVVFHIAPSNVDSIFIYSWFLSMLVGNINIIRLSSKSGNQIDLLLKTLNNLLELPEYSKIASRQVIVTYGHDDKITSYFSDKCDVRVIWGGDKTIQRIRQIPIPPTAIELPFTDKFSLCLLDAFEFIKLDGIVKNKLIHAFINDAYWFGQMACSSPRLVIWKGKNQIIEQAKEAFWDGVYNALSHDFTDISTADIVNKLVVSQSLAIEKKVILSKAKNNLINRIQLQSIDDVNTELHCGAGLFYEYSLEKLEGLIPAASRKIQTVSYFGIPKQELGKFISDSMPQGIDRFVPVGKALEFSPVWDGYNLLHEFTRVIDIS